MHSSSDDPPSPQYLQNSPNSQLKSSYKNNKVDHPKKDYQNAFKSSSNLSDSHQYKSNPFDSSDSFTTYLKRPSAPIFPSKITNHNIQNTRHSYPTNAFIRKSKDLKLYIISETERLINQDSRFLLGANTRQEIECLGPAPKCTIRKRMMKMGLL